jgi:DNA polymerase III epsilon subunit-like protein
MSYSLVIDTEFTGDDVLKNALINIGAILVRNSDDKEVDHLDLILNIPSGRGWDLSTRQWMLQQPEAVEIVQKVDKKEGLEFKDAMDRFVAFLKKCYSRVEGDMITGSDHLGIDNPWLNVYLSMSDYPPMHKIFDKLEHQVDIASFHQGCAQITHRHVKQWNTENELKKFSANVAALRYFNIRKPKTKYTHRAWMDAKYIASAHSKILQAIETINDSWKYSFHSNNYYYNNDYGINY